MNYIYEENRISIQKDEVCFAEIIFPKNEDGIVMINRTFVDPSLRGQGIAGKLMEEAIKQIEQRGDTVIPVCSYAVTWFSKHPEYKELLAK